ncbi:MAG: 6-bladed beta-propeller [Candidatus Aminicenantes bacterium]|nr:6-bladed beta-propeller [Candidatus Aminicenantes bacterium]
MKKHSLILIILICLFLSASYDSKQTQWKGEIDYEDGVKIMKNPQEPLYGEIEFELEEDLSISNETNEDYMFYRIRGMAVDSENNLFVVDMSNYRILVFNKKGKPIQTIGREGQGPGEFEMPIGLAVDDSTGDIYVGDRFRAIDVFNKNGDVKRTITSKLFIVNFFPLKDGTFFILVRKTSDEELSSEHLVCKINEKGEVLNSIAQFPYPTLMRRTSNGGTFGTSTGHELSAHVAVVNGEKMVYGYSKDYELKIINREGKLLYLIRKDAPKPKFTSEEQGVYKSIKFPVPESKPYFYSIFTDSKGRIYVQCNKSEEGIRGYGPIDKETKEVDIFSQDGYYLYKAVLPPNTSIIKNGYLYSLDLNEDEGIEYIKRYRIKNWDQIKEGISN